MRRGLTRNELGRKLGVTQKKLKTWEDNDEWMSDKETVLKIAFILSFPVGFFYGPEITPIHPKGCSIPGIETAYN